MSLRALVLRSVPRAETATIAGVPLRVSQLFVAVTLVVGFLGGRDVADTRLVRLPSITSVDEALHAFDPGSSLFTEITPSFWWAVAAGVGVAAIYALSVVAGISRPRAARASTSWSFSCTPRAATSRSLTTTA